MTLPNFLIIGAPKCGTTSLYHYLRQHPDVFMSSVKEARYYWREGVAQGRVHIHTLEAYERLFEGARSQRAVGEASPQYLNSPTAPERIAADLPGVSSSSHCATPPTVPTPATSAGFAAPTSGAAQTRPCGRAP